VKGSATDRRLKPATISEVARLAGVSIATVSRVLNGVPTVDPVLAGRVRSACAELSYQPNRAARRLAGHRSSLIGLLVTDIQNPFFMEIARGVEDVALEKGFLVALCNSAEDSRRERRFIEALCAEDIAGAIVAPTSERHTPLQLFLNRGIPVVTFDRRSHLDSVDAVLIDNVSAAREAVAHLIGNGYRRIAVIAGQQTKTTGHDRLKGYQLALQDAGIPREPLYERIGTFEQGVSRNIVGELLALESPPDALFTTNNRITMGALEAIHACGLRIPEDIAIACVDELPWASPVAVPLTVVRQPAYEIGSVAAMRLDQRIQQVGPMTRQDIVLAHQFEVRESSRSRTAVTP
jgi:DNA-binding LacI/PurR family transcriptional regulator